MTYAGLGPADLESVVAATLTVRHAGTALDVYRLPYSWH